MSTSIRKKARWLTVRFHRSKTTIHRLKHFLIYYQSTSK